MIKNIVLCSPNSKFSQEWIFYSTYARQLLCMSKAMEGKTTYPASRNQMDYHILCDLWEKNRSVSTKITVFKTQQTINEILGTDSFFFNSCPSTSELQEVFPIPTIQKQTNHPGCSSQRHTDPETHYMSKKKQQNTFIDQKRASGRKVYTMPS